MEGFCESMAVQLMKFNIRYIVPHIFHHAFLLPFYLVMWYLISLVNNLGQVNPHYLCV